MNEKQESRQMLNSVLMYAAVGGLLVVVWSSFVLYTTRPSDVLNEVQLLREDLARRNAEVLYRQEFENFLQQNQQLESPTIRVAALEPGGQLIVTEIIGTPTTKD